MFRDDGERGASLVEYALLVAMIALVAIGGISYFGNESGNRLERSKDSIVSAAQP